MPAGAAVVAFFAIESVAVAAVVAAAVNAAIVGAVVGAASAAISGGNILKGAVRGAVIGGVTGAVGGALGVAFGGTGTAGAASTTGEGFQSGLTADTTSTLGTTVEQGATTAGAGATTGATEGGLLADTVAAGNYTPISASIAPPVTSAAPVATEAVSATSNLGGIANSMKEAFSGIKTGDVFQGIGSMMSGVAQASGAKDVAATQKEAAEEDWRRRLITGVPEVPGVQITGVRQPINYNRLPINYQGV